MKDRGSLWVLLTLVCPINIIHLKTKFLHDGWKEAGHSASRPPIYFRRAMCHGPLKVSHLCLDPVFLTTKIILLKNGIIDYTTYGMMVAHQTMAASAQCVMRSALVNTSVGTS